MQECNLAAANVLKKVFVSGFKIGSDLFVLRSLKLRELIGGEIERHKIEFDLLKEWNREKIVVINLVKFKFENFRYCLMKVLNLRSCLLKHFL